MSVSDSPNRAHARPLPDLAAALGFLTVLPLGRKWPAWQAPRATGWYPWVGMLLGGCAALALWVSQQATGHWPTNGVVLAATLVLVFWGFSTRLQHWHGLVGTFDATMGASTVEGRLDALREGRIGAYGVAALVMFALLQAGALTGLVSAGQVWPLIAAPVLGRFAVMLAAATLPAARAEGLGLSTAGTAGSYEWVTAAVAVLCLVGLGLWITTPLEMAVTVAGGLIAAFLVPRILSSSVHGVTGETHGAELVIVETVVLVIACMLT